MELKSRNKKEIKAIDLLRKLSEEETKVLNIIDKIDLEAYLSEMQERLYEDKLLREAKKCFNIILNRKRKYNFFCTDPFNVIDYKLKNLTEVLFLRY